MKVFRKVIIFLIIIIPIIYCYFSLKNLWSEENIPADISDATKTNGDNENSENIENPTQGTTQTLGGESYTSPIGNPISKIVEGGEINISVVNVYTNPDENSDVVATLNKYTVVTSHAYPDGWSRVKSDTASGWVRTQYISIPEGIGNVTIGKIVGKKAVVNVTSLNVRSVASASGKKIDSLTENTEVTIIEVNEDETWYKIRWQSLEGWVKKDYLTMK